MKDCERNELLRKINELEQEVLTYKKYGLVWDKEKEKEKIVHNCEKNIPILKLVKEKSVLKGSENNILIEGDCYHSLLCLNYILKDSIDFIYIDPPYNTLHESGDGGFKYNDKFIGPDDTYKHSKYLNFMKKRLDLAHKLLKKDGTIFISIDDHEAADLKMLCDSIFGDSHFITMIPRITKKQRAGQEKYMDISHDYILAYSKADDFNNIIDRNYDERTLKCDKNGHYFEGDTKAILAAVSQGYSKGGDFDFFYNGKLYKPVTKEGVRNRWLWTKDRMEAAAKLGILVETRSTLRMQIYIDKKFEEKTNLLIPKDNRLIFHTSDFMTNTDYSNPNGVSDLTKISTSFLKKINNPKPVKLIKKLIQFCQNKNAVVLDFFAGSGTTGQAVLELNKEDGGKRKFILCTNNENSICTDVTYPRIKSIITGFKPDGNRLEKEFESNLFYFKTDFIIDRISRDQAKYDLVEKVDSILCILEDCYVEKERNSYSSHYVSTDKKKHMFIYNEHYNEKWFTELKSRIEKTKGQKIVYIYTSSNDLGDITTENKDKSIILKPIPSKIYEIYKEISNTLKRGE